MRSYFRPGLFLVVLAVIAGSWVVAQQGSSPPPPAPPAATPPPGPSAATPPPAPENPKPAPATERKPPPPAPVPPAPATGATPPPTVEPRVPLASPFPPPPKPPANAVAATVNGQAIPETAVWRVTLCQGDRVGEVRKEVLPILIDNALVDQYLLALKVNVDKKEVDDNLQRLKKEAAEQKEDFDKLLKSLHMTEEELRHHLICTLRWDKFEIQQSTDKALKEFFDKNRAMFDGSRMQVRHILVPPDDKAPSPAEAAKGTIAAIKKEIEEQAAQALAKLPAQADNLAREKERLKTLEMAFAKAAAEKSTCPSKEHGGDIGWIPRLGATVEPFARAAFALQPGQISDPVLTEFGCHLILAVSHQPGKEMKFDEMKPFVARVYSARLREAVITQMRPSAKITVNPPPKDGGLD